MTRMDAINTKSINEANLRNAKLKLTKLERAIRQVNDPDFGYCVVCDEPERLNGDAGKYYVCTMQGERRWQRKKIIPRVRKINL